VIDPCVGQGTALQLVTSEAPIRRYGVELDAERARIASANGIETIQGSAFDAVARPESFSLLYLNPPYDSELGAFDNKRMELLFLEHTYRWLAQGGVLLMVIQHKRVQSCVQLLAAHYNQKLAGGKWNHMMDQTHIGYTHWYSPLQNIMPSVSELVPSHLSGMGVAIEGGVEAAFRDAALPTFDSLNRQRSFIDVFPTGTGPIEFSFSAGQPWIVLTEGNAFSAGKNDRPIWVDIDWDRAPVGRASGTITIKGAQPVEGAHGCGACGPCESAPSTAQRVTLTAIKASEEQVREASGAFGGLVGSIAIAAEDATVNVPTGNMHWEKIPDYGGGRSAMEVFPVTAATALPPSPAPRLEYPVYFARAGKYQVDLVTGPTLDAFPGRALAVALSIDEQEPQIVKVFGPSTQHGETLLGQQFYENTSNNARIMHFQQSVDVPGKRTLKITMVDPTVVVQKIIIHDTDLPYSYFGPLESTLNQVAPGRTSQLPGRDW